MRSLSLFSLVIFLLTACSPSDTGTTPETTSPQAETRAEEAQPQEAEDVRYTYVLVHGASGGGWDWKTMDELLTAEGHTVYRPTLTGLGEKMHLSNADIDLTTHITDIVNVILFEDLHDFVLVGHSYGGMVITGVMNQVPERIRHAVYLDAAAPEDGMSAQDLWGIVSDSSGHEIVNGIVYFNWLDASSPVPRDVPQPLRTLTEPVSFDNPMALQLPVTFIAFVQTGQSLEARAADPSWQNASARNWTIKTLESDHNAQRSHPQELAEMLQAAPNDRNQD